MSRETSGEVCGGYGLHWRSWDVLLALTVVTLFLDGAPSGRGVLLSILIVATPAKAAHVAGCFMNLRFESLAPGLSVGLGSARG